MRQRRGIEQLLIFASVLFSPVIGCDAIAAGAEPAIAADLFVDDDNAEAQDGTALRPYRTVQQAIDAAKDNAVIAVAGGTYSQNIRVQEKAVRLHGGYVGGTASGYAGGTAGDFTERDPAAHPSHLKGDGKRFCRDFVRGGR